MASTFKNPPAFDPKSMTYETWKNEVKIWQLVTELKPEKQALAVSLTLSGNAKETAMDIPAADLAKETGMAMLLEQLDKVFLRDDKDKAYEAYKSFDTFHRSEGMSMSDFIIEFDKRYNKSKKYEMTLPEAVLAFKILDNAGLTSKDKQLALTASSDLKYDSMKSALRRIFGDSACAGSGNSGITLNEETAYFTQHRKFGPRQQKSEGSQRGTNPLNRFGKRTKCAICQSVFHWAKNCPEQDTVKVTESETVENCNVTLFTEEQASPCEIFMMEAVGSAVIDTACTRAVCGEKWFNQYIENVENNSVLTTESHRPFKFGDGQVVYSIKHASIPAKIGNTYCRIDTEVVKSDIPLLLSKSSLKKAGTVLDLKHDKATMFNEPVELEFTSSGHYCVGLLDKHPEKSICKEEEVLTIQSNMTDDEKRQILIKLHKQFGHATSDRLGQLLKSAGTTDVQTFSLLEEITKDCEVCATHKKPVARPVVGFPLATEYNETVAVDLHELEENKVWYLHIIDEFTRFSAGCILHSKKGTEFVKKFLESWISVHGAPKRLYSDNGGEFNNDEVRDMAENFNIEVKTTAAYSPWSNGLLERHNATLTEILLKVKEDNKCDWETALNWALMAKNALNNVHGYSPYQLVFGRNPNLPSVLIDNLPALEGTTRSKTVAKHIEALHTARKAFTQSESSEKIRRALRKQTRSNGNVKYLTGDKVFYKRPNCKEWKGPGTVIGQDGVVVFVRHGGSYVRVHQCRLMLSKASSTEEFENLEGESKESFSKGNEENLLRISNNESESDEQLGDQPIENDNHQHQPTGNDNHHHEDLEQFENENHTVTVDNSATISVKPGQIVKYADANTGQQCVAKVIGRAGKAKGNNKNWYNLRFSDPEPLKNAEISVDLSQVEGLDCSDNNENDSNENLTADTDNVMLLENVSFSEAKAKELASWKANEVYVKLADTGQKCISTRWICTLKESAEGIIPKARLVARGFEESQINDIPKDSPTCNTESLRTILAVIVQKGWKVHAMDIKTAFLQGSELARDIYVRPPLEANCGGQVWKLRKCVYGLVDASLNWYNRVREVMEQCGGEISQVDPAVFFWKIIDGNVQGILACHVDDFLWAGSNDFEQSVIEKVRSIFLVGREHSQEDRTFPYVGIELHSFKNVIYLSQKEYVKNLHPISLDKNRMTEKDALVTQSEREVLQSKIGQILWVARQSRPDIIFEASSLAASLKNATVKTILEVNKVIRSLTSESVELKFQPLGHFEDLKMVVFSDSSLGNLSDGDTQGGHFIMVMGNDGHFCPLTWQSKRIRRVVRSTLAGETLAMADAIDSAVFLATLFMELTSGQAKPEKLSIICVTDNHSLFDAVKSTKYVSDKRLRLEISSIKELIQSGQISAVKWVEAKRQLADSLTKKGASTFNLLKALSDGFWWDECLV